MSGPQREPTRLKILKGNPGKRKLPEYEAEPTIGLPPCPSHLTDAAKKEWRRMGKMLVDVGLMSKIDGTALAAYCDCYARWVTASNELQKHGLVVERGAKTTQAPDGTLTREHGTPMINPFIRLVRDAHEQMVVMLREFGMTPASRSRVHVQKPKVVNKLDEFLESA